MPEFEKDVKEVGTEPQQGGAETRTPGATGRPMNRRTQPEEMEPEAAEREAAGAQSGGTRKVAVTNKKNKRRAA